MFEVVKCLRENSSPTMSISMETAKPEEVKKKKKRVFEANCGCAEQTQIK